MKKGFWLALVLVIAALIGLWLWLASRSSDRTTTTAAPTQLQINDLVIGTGEAAKAGDQLTVNYIGTLADGTEFDNSYKRGQSFKLTLGAGQVIAGWDQGLVGMKTGGKRELIIPPDLGYGSSGYPPTIPPDATLKFTIELVKITQPTGH